MLQETVDRVSPGLIAPETLYVITSEQHVETVRRQLPDIPPQNVVGEPVGRDSAPAIGLMAALIEAQLGPETIMAVLASDHAIHDVAAFQNCLRAAAFEARSGYLVTLGIPPTSPDTGFGYIKRGDSLHTGSVPAFVAESFREKPSRIAAEEYVASGEYYWNAGMFIAQVSAFRALYQKFLPEMEPELKEMVAVFGTDHQTTAFARHFPRLPKVSFDYAIAEKAQSVAVIPAHIGWSDVGSWERLAELLAGTSQAGQHGNIAFGHTHHELVESSHNLVFAPDKIVATLGVDNLVIVDTPDALLVTTRERAGEIKLIVDALRSEGRQKLL